MALSDLNHLTPGFDAAVKNNSTTSFFAVRDIIFTVLTDKTKKMFQREDLILGLIPPPPCWEIFPSLTIFFY